MKQPSRRRAPTRSRKQKDEITPEKIREYLGYAYDARQLAWSEKLRGEEEEIDWTYLLGLHLQMCELEHLQRTLVEIAE